VQLRMRHSSSLACDGQDRVHHGRCLVKDFCLVRGLQVFEVQCEINPIQQILVTVRVF
jgi:hypothetical protein